MGKNITLVMCYASVTYLKPVAETVDEAVVGGDCNSRYVKAAAGTGEAAHL